MRGSGSSCAGIDGDLSAADCATKARAGEPVDETARPAAESVEPYACGDSGGLDYDAALAEARAISHRGER